MFFFFLRSQIDFHFVIFVYCCRNLLENNLEFLLSAEAYKEPLNSPLHDTITLIMNSGKLKLIAQIEFVWHPVRIVC